MGDPEYHGILKAIAENPDGEAMTLLRELAPLYRYVYLSCGAALDGFSCNLVNDYLAITGHGKTPLDALRSARAEHDRLKARTFWDSHTVEGVAAEAVRYARRWEPDLADGVFYTKDFDAALFLLSGPHLTYDEVCILLSACPHVVRLSTPDLWFLLPGDLQRKD
jgi:hypothetical protein